MATAWVLTSKGLSIQIAIAVTSNATSQKYRKFHGLYVTQ
jgi:hypothetical protein